MNEKKLYVFIKDRRKWRYYDYDTLEPSSYRRRKHFVIEELSGAQFKNFYLKGTARHLLTCSVVDNIDTVFKNHFVTCPSFCESVYEDYCTVYELPKRLNKQKEE